MRFTDDARALLKRLEGFSLVPYRDQGGVWTVGYGHTGPDVVAGEKWTPEECEEALNDDLQRFTLGVERSLAQNHAPPLNDNQFSALVVFSYNVGLMALAGSTAMRRIQQGQFADVPAALALWNKVHDRSGVPVVNDILVKRRTAEAQLWNTPAGVA